MVLKLETKCAWIADGSCPGTCLLHFHMANYCLLIGCCVSWEYWVLSQDYKSLFYLSFLQIELSHQSLIPPPLSASSQLL